MRNFSLHLLLVCPVFFFVFVLNHQNKKLEKQNATIEIIQNNEKEMLKLIDTMIENDKLFLKVFCELHICDKSEENLIENNIY